MSSISLSSKHGSILLSIFAFARSLTAYTFQRYFLLHSIYVKFRLALVSSSSNVAAVKRNINRRKLPPVVDRQSLLTLYKGLVLVYFCYSVDC